jgi:hypothetical protein
MMSTSNNGLSLRWIVASSDRGSARRSLKTSSAADLMSLNGPRPAGEKEGDGPSRSCGEVAPATACIVTRTSEDDMVSLCGNNAGRVCRSKGICQESWQRRLGVGRRRVFQVARSSSRPAVYTAQDHVSNGIPIRSTPPPVSARSRPRSIHTTRTHCLSTSACPRISSKAAQDLPRHVRGDSVRFARGVSGAAMLLFVMLRLSMKTFAPRPLLVNPHVAVSSVSTVLPSG